MDIEKKLLEKLLVSPIALIDLTTSEHSIIGKLMQSRKIIRFIDNGSCNYPISTLHSDAYYIKLA